MIITDSAQLCLVNHGKVLIWAWLIVLYIYIVSFLGDLMHKVIYNERINL